MILPRRLLGLVLAGLMASPGLGRAADPAIAAPIEALNEGLLAVMKAGSSTPFPRRYGMLAPAVDQAFDLAAILRACVGPRWASLAQREQAALFDVFRPFTIASYVANFDGYAGERFEVLPDLRASGTDEIVATRIVLAEGGVRRIDYVMRRTPGGWKAVDVLLDGTISRVAVQRSDFRSLLGGADASGLIASLRRKVADLSGGTLSAG